ncbi:long-chain fatty acid--CoA ligase [Terrabacter sp. GCM10028922]|uniref:acyl-CoA synthetase n=1 Tax=Terrabacter sp. GCM10028922 TaxID=3273428 RepID=UPI0036228009
MTALQPSGNQGVGSWPWRRARMSPHATALRQGDRALSYTQLADRAGRLATALRQMGVESGDRVAFLGTNDLATFETFFASGLLGAVFVPLNTRLAAPELAYLLQDCGAGILVVGNGVDAVAARLSSDPELSAVMTVGAADVDALLPTVAPLEPQVDVTLADPALLLYTSGTTGRPKAATLTHGNLTWNTVNQLAHFDTVSSDRALCIAPLFHAVGLGQVTLPTLFKGGSVDVLDKFDAATVLRLVGQHGITSFSAVPTMLQLMAEDPAWPDADLSSLRHVVYGGSSVNEWVARAWLDRGVRVLQGYGMTEAAPGIYMALHDGAATRPVSVGVPHFFTDVAALEGDGTVGPVPHDGPGLELLVRGPNVFAGYWDHPEETQANVVDDRWFRTGDIVRADDDDWAYVVDRVKDVIISGGENIYPAEVEAVAVTLAGIRSAAVVALADDSWGEVGVAFVETVPGATVTEDQLRAHFEANLARFKIPKHIRFVDALPRNATGKIRRVDLRERAARTPHEETR